MAESSYKHFNDCDIHGELENTDELGKFWYHLSCYRNFTDITKLEIAKYTLRNLKTKPAESAIQFGEVVLKGLHKTVLKQPGLPGIAPV